MSRALHYDVPGPDWRVALPAAGELSWQRVFAPALAPPLRLAVEIGFGRGEFLMRLAADQPDVAFVGIEYSFKRVLKVARRLARTRLTNVRLVQAEGRQAVRELLEPASVEAFWINFPDPWPKARHAGRRIVQSPFVSQMASRMHILTLAPESGERVGVGCDERDVGRASARRIECGQRVAA